jgi:transposase-like protein|tara:strand:+ start:2629 stop:2796 length:168 start_codon:yes stop_codon:yes gene_type:complete
MNRFNIEMAAQELGAGVHCMYKWRTRQLPHKWRIEISEYLGVTPKEVSAAYDKEN